MDQKELDFRSPAGSLRYLLGLPANYAKNAGRSWLLILFLHGRGERGSDLSLLKAHGIPREVHEADDFPFVTVSPQCPEDADWPDFHRALIWLLDEVVADHAVDSRRVYLTGLSLGGRGTWGLAVNYPERFAAIASICGRVPDMPDFFDKLAALESVPVWAFHGARDEVVPVENSEKICAALRARGSDARLTI